MDKRKLLGAVFVIVAIGLGFLIYFIAKDQWWDDSKESSQPAKQESKKDNSKDDEKIEESKKKLIIWMISQKIEKRMTQMMIHQAKRMMTKRSLNQI